MALDSELGKKMLQLITSRYDDRHWRKKIEKTLSLPQSGVADPVQQQLFMYLKIGLKAQLVGPDLKKEDIAFLGTDPGDEVTEGWWDEMLVQWFDVPEEEKPAEGEEEGKTDGTESAATAEEQSSKA
jgi:hypothetical protein